MSENRDTVRGFGAVEDREQPPSPSDSDHVDSPDDPNGFVHVKTPSFTNENDVGGSLYQVYKPKLWKLQFMKFRSFSDFLVCEILITK